MATLNTGVMGTAIWLSTQEEERISDLGRDLAIAVTISHIYLCKLYFPYRENTLSPKYKIKNSTNSMNVQGQASQFSSSGLNTGPLELVY